MTLDRARAEGRDRGGRERRRDDHGDRRVRCARARNRLPARLARRDRHRRADRRPRTRTPTRTRRPHGRGRAAAGLRAWSARPPSHVNVPSLHRWAPTPAELGRSAAIVGTSGLVIAIPTAPALGLNPARRRHESDDMTTTAPTNPRPRARCPRQSDDRRRGDDRRLRRGHRPVAALRPGGRRDRHATGRGRSAGAARRRTGRVPPPDEHRTWRTSARPRHCHARRRGSAGNDREQLHGEAIGAWLAGDWIGAGDLLDEVLYRWPTDLLALTIAHQLAFFVGDAPSLRDRPLRTLLALDPEHPHTGFVRGMAAFGLEESGHYAEALDAGMAAVAANRDDVWAVHAVAHTHEMRGEVDAGHPLHAIRPERLAVRQQLHGAQLVAPRPVRAGSRPHRRGARDLRPRGAPRRRRRGRRWRCSTPSAMLWRLHLDRIDSGQRFAALADTWAPKAMDRSVVRVQRRARRARSGRAPAGSPRRARPRIASPAGCRRAAARTCG